MEKLVLDNRMKKVSECVRTDAILADVGTDHGKLPVYLALNGKIKRAVASDINEMPLKKAADNIKKYGLSDIIDTCLTDGLNGLEKYSPTDVVIAGMGGELIEYILRNSKIQGANVRFILQPMTKADGLREYLTNNGYEIYDEQLAEEGRIYQIICAEYTGKNTDMTREMLLLGKKNIEKGDVLFGNFCDRVVEVITAKIEGRSRAGLDIVEDAECVENIKKIKKEWENENDNG